MAHRGRMGAIGVALIAVLLVGIIPLAAQAKPMNPRAALLLRAGNPSGLSVFRATNASRLVHHVHGVTLNARLSDLARQHSRAMAGQHRLFHSPNPDRYLQGMNWSTWGENVGYTTGDTAQLQNAFMRSLVHRHNILDSRFQHVAVGSIRYDGALWVTVFFYG